MYQYNPFEQFEIVLLYPYVLHRLDLSITNLGILLIVMVLLILSLNQLLSKSYTYIPNNWQIVMEALYQFVLTMLLEQTGVKGVRYLPQLLLVFISVLFFNLCGLIPFSFTVSSHLVITFTLALSFFIAWIIIGIKELRLQFFNVFCPRNMPLWLLPLLICVEFISFALRPISLGVRLFANMLAGHILLHILAGAFLYLLAKLVILALPAYAIISAIGVLELGIGFLQAYIFCVLLCIYLKDSLHAH
jgi:ATP synthase subunit 6